MARQFTALGTQLKANMADKSSIKSKKLESNMFLSVSSRAASAYSSVAVDARVSVASPHELITMLFDGLLESLAGAQGAMKRHDTAAKGKAVNKCILLLGEGLKGGLSPQGGELSQNLNNLYDYCILRLTQANLNNDEEAIEEVRSLVVTVADSWKNISHTEQGDRNA